MLGAFYNIPIEFGEFGRSTLHDILEMAIKVIEVAEYLQVVRECSLSTKISTSNCS